MAINDMGDIDALGGVFADDRLDRLLLGEVQLVSVEKQEGLIVNGEHLLVALVGVEGDSLVPFQTSLDHPVDE